MAPETPIHRAVKNVSEIPEAEAATGGNTGFVEKVTAAVQLLKSGAEVHL